MMLRLQVFEVAREGESERYEPQKNLGNRRLLWHGSRTSNFGGILSQGMRIAPPEAPKTGYRFVRKTFPTLLVFISTIVPFAGPRELGLVCVHVVRTGQGRLFC